MGGSYAKLVIGAVGWVGEGAATVPCLPGTILLEVFKAFFPSS